ncbi:glycoside hydrolase family 2 protein [Candidatus Pristimantibacillus sp. PTI5]|uniref:glycoside hydrolase family 2 protein n=1 Tax=Candidatus Pristimantibacillus sp. PTI5 TaxID=3400422 RepID=UPI003B014F06
MIKLWNKAWHFSKTALDIPQDLPVDWEVVNLPHTWNGKDGQDGGNDYHRGTCYYTKKLRKEDISAEKLVYLEFQAANSSADVYVNGRHAGHHDGGYSTWRVNITDLLADENLIVVAVNNAPNARVYPQEADFTFYGGLYRNVSVITVTESHFDLDYYGGPGVEVTPVVNGSDAEVDVQVFLTGALPSQQIIYRVKAADQIVSEQITAADTTRVKFTISKAHLWNGRKDPFLYALEVRLVENGKELDRRDVKFGCRSFKVDPEKGFFLNGESYPLRGVNRHQDRPEIGNALLPEHQNEDMDLICEMGATTIRLAHYQHDQYFLDLCDERGMIVWAEIPYIACHMVGGKDNTLSQMRELVIQNYNHPSIMFWGLSNEITILGADDEDMVENHRILNDMVHEMDPTRLTTLAVIKDCSIDKEYVHITDVVSYNLYLGWYVGETYENGIFMDEFHEKFPNKPIGLSEYGCEAAGNWHTSTPGKGDYTEDYQAYYHEELIKQLFVRPYIWATHVWNMFDFGSDARAEGGKEGINHKGLVSFDRKYKKDAFYAYKAWLTDEPFVHICGKRYVDRVEEVTRVTVYSNQPEVELFADGKSLGKQNSDVHFFYFDVPLSGETSLVAKAGKCEDESLIRKVDVFNEDYRMKQLKEVGDIINWFELTAPDGYFSINDKVGDIASNPQGALIIQEIRNIAAGAQTGDGSENSQASSAPQMDAKMQEMVNRLTVRRVFAGRIPKEKMLELNTALNKIKKTDK